MAVQGPTTTYGSLEDTFEEKASGSATPSSVSQSKSRSKCYSTSVSFLSTASLAVLVTGVVLAVLKGGTTPTALMIAGGTPLGIMALSGIALFCKKSVVQNRKPHVNANDPAPENETPLFKEVPSSKETKQPEFVKPTDVQMIGCLDAAKLGTILNKRKEDVTAHDRIFFDEKMQQLVRNWENALALNPEKKTWSEDEIGQVLGLNTSMVPKVAGLLNLSAS